MPVLLYGPSYAEAWRKRHGNTVALVQKYHFLNLNEFITTVTELIAMAPAATIGLSTPVMASGRAATL